MQSEGLMSESLPVHGDGVLVVLVQESTSTESDLSLREQSEEKDIVKGKRQGIRLRFFFFFSFFQI